VNAPSTDDRAAATTEATRQPLQAARLLLSHSAKRRELAHPGVLGQFRTEPIP
jgi:hypothetical protein